MKKLIFVLACLMAVPAFGLTVELVDNLDGTIDVVYSGADTANRPSGFGLVVTLTGGATVTSVTPEIIGESETGNIGFGIFPGTIIIDGSGVVTDDGTPVALAGDPGTTGTGLGTASVVLELGALYVGDANKPDVSGTLCTIAIDCTPATAQVDASVAAEGTFRGGIVLRDATVATGVTFNGLTDICASGGCACKGDINADGKVSVADMSAIIAYLSPTYAGTVPPYTATPVPAGDECYDVNGDGKISVADMSAVIAFLSPAYSGTVPPYTYVGCMP